MKSLLEKMPEDIAWAEAEFGKDSPFVSDLKRQYEAMKANQGKSLNQVYQMGAVQRSPSRPSPEADSEADPMQGAIDQIEEAGRNWFPNDPLLNQKR